MLSANVRPLAVSVGIGSTAAEQNYLTKQNKLKMNNDFQPTLQQATVASSAGIQEDIQFVKAILPEHYTVQESKKAGSIHCKSSIGIRKSPYTVYPYSEDPNKSVHITDAEDDEHWGYIFKAIKQHFGERFQEVFHNTCFCHVDFTIYLNAR